MRPTLLWTITLLVTILLTIPLLFLPTAQTEEQERECLEGLPNPADYRPASSAATPTPTRCPTELPNVEADFPPAGPTCKKRMKLAPWGPGGKWIPETGHPGLHRCQLHVTVCGGVRKCYESEGRVARAGFCDDYSAMFDALLNREICCDEKPANCEDPSPTPKPPWFDTRNCPGATPQGVEVAIGPQIVDLSNRPLPAGEIWCVVRYEIPGEYSSDPGKTIPVIKKVTVDLTSWRNDWQAAAETACRPFFDEHWNLPRRAICPGVWQDAGNEFVRRGGSCDPISDVDCDGVPNGIDPFPLHPRQTEYVSSSPLTNFPFWKDFNNAIPHDLCDCKWELSDVRYRCANVKVSRSDRRGSSNQARYQYQVKWKCPDTGRTVVVSRETKMDGLYCPRGRARP